MTRIVNHKRSVRDRVGRISSVAALAGSMGWRTRLVIKVELLL